MSRPAGIVTFLFTDIEGSTKSWQQHPDAMVAALARHHAILREAIESHHGYVFQIIGDAFCAAFSAASDAVEAALAAQRELCNAPWGETGPLRARMALHTGPAEVRAGDYTSGEYVSGLTLSRAARLLSAGHGGQVLLSMPTQESVRSQLPPHIALRDMGERRLKDLIRPEHIYQLVTPDLPNDFAPLKTLDARPNNLPVQLTSFVGREREMAEVKHLLTPTHLLTLTGSGGAGKTRLSLQIAADLIDDFDHGVWFIDLAPLSDPTFVPQTIATTLGVREEPQRPVLDTLSDYLRDRALLLILDNCEHLVDACARVADKLLRAAPNLKILATSREALRISGEVTYSVPSLRVPDPQRMLSIESLTKYEAVRLFCDRAVAALPSFKVNEMNAVVVVQICQRLDGIPLAIELAAARVRGMAVEQLAARLDDRFRLLARGSRAALPRQQTLRALVDWSYDLLSESERALFRGLAVFAGGWKLEAAEEVCAGDGVEAWQVFDLLGHLVDKSLVMIEETEREVHYRLLETVRQYALERLVESGREQEMRSKHRDFFLMLAEDAEPHLKGAEQAKWLNRLEEEHNDLRAALEWCESGTEDVEAGLRLVGALWRFWYMRGYLSEGRERIASVLSRTDTRERTQARAKALRGAGVLAEMQGDYAVARSSYEESLAIARDWGDQPGIASALNDLGLLAFKRGEYGLTRSLYEESLAIYRELRDRWGIALSLNNLGNLAWRQGDYALAHSLCEESLTTARALGDKQLVRLSLFNLGLVARDQSNYELARSRLKESLAIARELGNKPEVAFVLNELGVVALDQGDPAQAGALFEESLTIHRELANKQGTAEVLNNLGFLAAKRGEYERARALHEESLITAREIGAKQVLAETLDSLASLALTQGQPGRAARLLAAVEALREALEVAREPAEQARYESNVAAARIQSDEHAFDAAWREGRAMTLEQAAAYALEQPLADEGAL